MSKKSDGPWGLMAWLRNRRTTATAARSKLGHHDV
jgi:hypothetical protein